MEKTNALENEVIREEDGNISVDWSKFVSSQGKDEYSKTLNKLVEKGILKKASWERDDTGSFLLVGTGMHRNPCEIKIEDGRIISETMYYFLKKKDAVEYAKIKYRQVAYNIYLIQLKEGDIINPRSSG